MLKKIFGFAKRKDKKEEELQEVTKVEELDQLKEEEEKVQELEITDEINDKKEEVEAKIVENEVEEPQQEEKVGFFGRLKKGLSKTRNGFVVQVENLFSKFTSIDEELFEELEEILIQADVGVHTTMNLVDDLRERAKEEKIKEPKDLTELFKDQLVEILSKGEEKEESEQPTILMVVGVNGAGKTTTIGKIAQRTKEAGMKVLLGAGDTFRAAAIDQLKVWSSRVGVDIIAHQEGADSAAVAYDAVQAAKSRGVDLLIVDTAGRLHTQSNLMQELEKVKRVITREAGEMKVEVLLVLDATTGQNAVNQAKLFNDAVAVDGIALTKLDGTAKGGVVIAIKEELGIPIKLIGVGESAEDLQDFEAESFIEALFSQ